METRATESNFAVKVVKILQWYLRASNLTAYPHPADNSMGPCTVH
jgi:hypothetical protein